MRLFNKQKFVSVLSAVFMLVNSFGPYSLAIINAPATPAIAQEVTQEPTQAQEPTSEPTSEPTAELTSEPTAEPESIEPTVESTPTVVTPTATETTTTSVQTPTQEATQTPVNTNASVATPTVQVVPTISDENAVVDTTVIETSQCRADSLNGCDPPTLETDKEDYAPTEAALITGSGFAPYTTYRLVVFSNDEPATRFESNITTNTSGSFSVSYQLDGIYRPDYVVEVYDNTNALIARTTFTDSYPAGTQTLSPIVNGCIQDTFAAAGNTQKLNCTANDISIANVTNITIKDDGCQFPGDTVTFEATYNVVSTATERYDVGLYFSNDGGGLDGAYTGSCTIGTLPYGPTPAWKDLDGDQCGDITSAQSLNPILEITALCMDTDNDNNLNLPYCTAWSNSDKQTCSLPNQAIPETPAKCNCQGGFEVPIIVPHQAKIEVVKDLIPSNDTGTFKLQIDSTDKTSCISDGGSTGQVNVSAGTSANPGATHTVGETACAGTTISNYTSSITCVKRGTQTVVATANGTGPLNVPVQKDDDIVCTITNTVNQGQLKVVKNTVGDNGTFDFIVSGPSASTPQITTSGNTGTTGFVSVNTGSYDISETVPTNWQFDSASCVNGQGQSLGTPTGSSVQDVTVGPNDQVTCTFNNTRLRNITACKYNDLTGDGQDQNDPMLAGWEMTLNPGGVKQVTDQNGCTTFTGLAPNDYTVSETTQTNWTAITQTTQDVDLTGSQDETVYFGNFACATITGSKWEDLNGNGVWDQGEPTVANWPINLSGQSDAQTTTDENGEYSFKVCTPGIHVVAEGTLNADEWYQTFPAYEYDVDVNSGGTYENNDFGNARYARIYGFKYQDNDGDGQLDANDLLDTLGGWVFELYDGVTNALIDTYTTLSDGFFEFTGLLAGKSYYVKEQQQAGWTQTYGPQSLTPTPIGMVSGADTRIDFANFKLISISGTKYNDVNGNGSRDQEPGLQGWTIFIDLNDNQTLDQGEVSTTTDANGNYSFSNLGPGTYVVCEVAQAGWTQTSSPECHSVTAASGQNATGKDFGNQGRSTLILKKVLNPTDDTSLWDMDVTGDNVSEQTTLGHNQTDQFELPAGEYAIVESPDETVENDIYDSSYECSNEQSGNGRNIDDITLNPGETVTCTFTNVARGSITVIKDVVPNDNTFWDFALKAGQQTVGSTSLADNGSHPFTNLVNGAYVLSEETSELYTTDIDCGAEGTATNQGSINLDLNPGESITCTYTNTRIQANSLSISFSTKMAIFKQPAIEPAV
ncbi:MAG: Serine-aspartate repeat-containing protein F precursor [Microgenomates bacterium OLB23]|nr:MAG: Serine-aspartate repeat-containing protein F precursor [Microgenomates bacterium OLB23]